MFHQTFRIFKQKVFKSKLEVAYWTVGEKPSLYSKSRLYAFYRLTPVVKSNMVYWFIGKSPNGAAKNIRESDDANDYTNMPK